MIPLIFFLGVLRVPQLFLQQLLPFWTFDICTFAQMTNRFFSASDRIVEIAKL